LASCACVNWMEISARTIVRILFILAYLDKDGSMLFCLAYLDK